MTWLWGHDQAVGAHVQVRVAVSKVTGREFACKSIPKALDVPGISPGAQAAHLANVEKEVRVLRRLQGTLSVVHLESVHEDDESVHIVMEYCRGGELLHHLSHVPHYSESTARPLEPGGWGRESWAKRRLVGQAAGVQSMGTDC